MNVPRTILALTGVIVIAIGVPFLLAPVAMMQTIDIAVASPLGLGDIRAIYGGMQIGAGVLLLLASRRAELVRPGLIAAAILFAGMFGGRVFAMLLDGAPPAFGWLLAFAELSGLVITFAMSRRA